MRIVVLREQEAGEKRVALLPDAIRKLSSQKIEVAVESGAGIYAGASDDDYKNAGAVLDQDRRTLLESADVLVAVNRPPATDLALLHRAAVVIGFLRPLDEPAALEPMIARGLTAFAMELVPRITRAQAMDALSSMATIAGYKAVLIAADNLPKLFPMLTTAAGTIAPVRVLVLGAGVAGLQAIATARRLGAVVEGYDIRAAAGEQVRSLGARFLDVDLGGIQTEDTGGYAKELTEEALNRGRDLIAEHAKNADVIITTAQVPGRRAPLLLTEQAVGGMRIGSIIVDLAGASGGNCALTRPGETFEENGVIIMAPLNLAATVPIHASQLYSRNVANFLALILSNGELKIDRDDEILKGSAVAFEGSDVHPRVAATLGQTTAR
jgi:proton-translocating NAD(P)+ transhydrogenase subunit alpha